MADDHVVISGIGANLPQSDNLQHFGKNLLDNKYLPTPNNRWKLDTVLEVEPVSGQVAYEAFDAEFYGINRQLAKNTDPVSKMGYQRSFEAILDAGVHPQSLRGKNIGVYVACGVNELEQRMVYSKSSQKSQYGGYTIMGSARTMLPNRISYFFDFTGPSLAMDGSWGGAHLLLDIARKAILSGEVEAAVVVASYLVRFPEASALMRDLGLISGDGLTKSFAEDANGSIRSDSSIAFFVQREDAAKRCYARVLAAGMEYVGLGSKTDVALPNPRGMQAFLSRLYRTHGIDPKRIAYLEADGSAHPIRDECELDSIDAALVKGAGRSQPLLLGSVKSNVGYADCANGLAGVCKAIAAMETGTIPATINHDKHNPRIKALTEGRMRVVAANTPLDMAADGVVAVNNLGLACTLGHSVLAPNKRAPQPAQDPAQHLPRLLTISGRTEEGVLEVANKIMAAPFDTNYYRLVQDTFSADIRGYDYRSYVVCPPASANEKPPVERVEKRAIWFCFSGMGSQWAGMGEGLMRLPIFGETIDRLHTVLREKGVDLKQILSETGPAAFDNILKSFVGITACQIALVNVMTAMGVVPDGIIGHSVGEVACAYVDGCLTEEQAILTAWARGVASNQATLIKGMMAAIGLGYKDVLPRLPPSIDVACHNSDSSCTLSGPAEDVQRFVKQLSDEGVFARAVNVSDIAYHSRYIQPAAPFLREQLQKVIPHPKARSYKWLTTSVPEEKRETDLGKYCSVDYQTNNLLSPVLFEEALGKVHAGSLVIEIAPHGLLQAILKRALPAVVHVSLTQRGQSDSIRFLLNAIGKTSLYFASPNVSALYPDVEFPVPRGTASLAELVTWAEDLNTTADDIFGEIQERMPNDLPLHVDTHYLKVNGKRLLPLSQMLMFMWTNAAHCLGLAVASYPVTFRDVRVTNWPHVGIRPDAWLDGEYMHGTAQIEVSDDCGQMAAVGRTHQVGEDWLSAPPHKQGQETVTLHRDDVYRDMRARGLEYVAIYQNIKSVEIGDEDWLVTVRHSGRWTSMLESIVQIYVLRHIEETNEVCLPWSIQRLDLDPVKFKKNEDVVLRLHLKSGVVSGDGVYVAGFQLLPCPPDVLSSAKPVALELAPAGQQAAEGGAWRTKPLAETPSVAVSASMLDDVRVEVVGANPLVRTGPSGLSGHVDYVGVDAKGGRVMGVAQWLADNCRPRPDALLRWPVPQAWSAEDAATVPFVYSVVYAALRVRARAQRGESMLVHEGFSALGQAAIRVATQMGCSPIYSTVRDAKEREQLRALFPQLEPGHILPCGHGGSFEFRVRMLTHGKGVRLVVNTLPDAGLKASVRCTSYWGRVLHFNRQDMLACRTIGSHAFLSSITVYGFSGNELFNSREPDRVQVAEAVAQGLREGVVKPIVGAKVYASGIREVESGSSKAVIKVASASPAPVQQCSPDKCYLVAANQASEALLVAVRLAVLGARRIVAAVGTPSNSAQLRQRTLRRLYGAHLTVQHVRSWDAAAAEEVVKAAASVAPLDSVVVVSASDGDVAVSELLSEALSSLPAVRLVLLAAPSQAQGQAQGLRRLASLASRRNAQGRGTTCMAAPLPEAVDYLTNLLGGATPPVTLLPVDAGANGLSEQSADFLPSTASALRDLSRRAALCADGAPQLLELASLGLKACYPGENQPLFVLPPFGLLEAESRAQLAGLAARLFNPVIVVETCCRGDLKSTARAVVQAIVRQQSNGPYNVLGWRLSTVLALEVQRQLESAGKGGVLFMVHGDVGLVQQWAKGWLSARSLAEAVQGADAEAVRGAEVAASFLRAIADHESDVTRPFGGRAHALRISPDDLQSFDENDLHFSVRTISERNLDDATLSTYVNEHSAYSQLAGYDDLRSTIEEYAQKGI